MKSILNKIDRSWMDKYNYPLVISGPCSAENEIQVLKTAKQLTKISGVNVFRAGIWKPRTKPNSFEGVGEIGLKWLNKVKMQTGLMISTEVANSEHVKLCIDYNIDILWIGARTTASPFSMQEISEALEGTDKIVLVKNPIHPDIELWIGGLERLYNKGIRKLGMIHRGFYIYKNPKYRNQPNWNFLMDIKKIIPNIPILCDPSHICGNRVEIPEISKIACNYFKCDGLMIETHYNPNKAWSDSNQQITPDRLFDILTTIKYNNKINNLYILRVLIDELDENIISIISKRMNISKKLGKVKKTGNIPVLQSNRWNIIIDKYINMSKDLGISNKFIIKIFELLHKESIRIQNNIIVDN